MEKKNYKILLVEDDNSLSKGLKYALEKQNFEIDLASTFITAEKLFYSGNHDLLILDVGLPDRSGFDLCEEIRKVSNVPVIFLTACDEEVNIVLGLDIGGDDYITKPFRVTELISRINAVMRRRGTNPEGADFVKSGRIYMDRRNLRVCKDGKTLTLTSTEYKLLQILMVNKGNIIGRERIIEALWDKEEHFVDSNTLSVYIRRLREKIEDNPDFPDHIKTVRGTGYKWQ